MGKRKPYFNDGRKNNDPRPHGAGIATRFQPGHSPVNTSLVKRLEKLGWSRDVINDRIAEITAMNQKQLKQLRDSEETTMIELIIISVLSASKEHADTGRMDNILDKILGKQATEIRTTNTNYNVDTTLEEVADDELMQRAAERSKRYSEKEKKK